MRYLILEAGSTIEEQKAFFDQFIWPGGVPLCDAISNHPVANFYRSTAHLAKAFLFIEQNAFSM